MTSRLHLLAAAVLALAAGCGDDPPPRAATSAPTLAKRAPTKAGAGAAADEEAEEEDAGPILSMELREGDFVEAEGERRDPFRNYSKVFSSTEGAVRTTSRVPVLLPEVPIDELRLIAIVSGVGTPRAMILDSSGVGTIVRRGDYVGRGDIVRGGPDGAAEFPINWRVSKILTDGIVLVREDPTTPGRAPITRMIELHPEARPDSTPRR